MPADNVIRDVLLLETIADTKPAIKSVTDWAREYVKRSKLVEKSIDKIGKVSRRVEVFTHKHNVLWLKSTRQQVAQLHVQAKSISDLTLKIDKEEAALRGMSFAAKSAALNLAKSEEALSGLKDQLKKVGEEEAKAKKEGIAFDEDRRKSLEERIKQEQEVYNSNKRTLKQQDLLKKSVDETREALKSAKAAALGEDGVVALDAIDKIKEEVKKSQDELYSGALAYRTGKLDMGEGLRDAISSIGAKDMKGMAGGFAKMLSSAGKGAGASMARWGAAKQVDPTAGAMGKAMGKMAGSLGGMVGQLAKFGPMLSMTAGLFMAIVKTLLDAESAAKEFNKDILSSASTVEILHKEGLSANASYYVLRDTMDDIRDAATDAFENIKWGISKKQHVEFLNALTSEGVSLQTIRKDAETAGKSVKDFSADMVHVAVAYSRNFGVSLNEVATFQGEMVRELGIGLGSVKQQFAMMSRAASDSTISANKFFGIIRSFSADMSLFNLRMEEAVGILKTLGKVMSPKNAEKFMRTITDFYKGMGLEDRIKATLLAGKGATAGMLQKDMKVKIEGLAADVAQKLGGGAGDELKKALSDKNPKAVAKFMAKYQDQLTGSMREGILDAQIQQGKLAKGGLVDVASALKEASPATVIEHLDTISKKMFKVPMDQLSDVQRLAFTKIANVSDEQIDQLTKAKAGITQMREDIAYRLEHGEKLSDEQRNLLDRLHVSGTDAEKAAAVRGKEDNAIWHSLSELQRKQLQGTDKELDYAKEQSSMLSTVTDKLEVIADYLLNLIYKGIVWILDAIPGADQERAQARMQMAVMKSGNKSLQDAFEKSGGDVGKFKGAALMETDVGQKTAGILVGTAEEIAKLREKQDELVKVTNDASKSDAERAAATQEANKISKEIEAKQDLYSSTLDTFQKRFSQYGGFDQAQMLSKAIMDAQVSGTKERPARISEAMDKVKGGMKWETALSSSGFDEKEIGQILGKAMWTLDPELVAGALAEQAKKSAPSKSQPRGEEPPPAPSTEPSSAQSEATAKSSAPGTGGTPAPVSTETKPAEPPPTTTKATDPSQKGIVQQTAISEDQLKSIQTTNAALDDLDELMRRKGVVLNKTFMADKLGPLVEDHVLNAVRVALFEYWMYSDEDRDMAAKGLKEGKFTPGDFGQKKVEWATTSGGATTGDYMKSLGITAAPVPGNQVGGLIKGVTPDGMAVVQRPPPGEGLMSGAPGEVVGRPGQMAAAARGGGGGDITVKLELSQDLQKVIRAEAGNVVYLSRARERFQG